MKIGLLNVLSGQFADAGIQLDNGVKTYMKQHGDTVAGKKIEIIRRTSAGRRRCRQAAGAGADRARRRRHAGGILLAERAAADVSAQGKFMVVMNAATSIIITKSPT